MKSADRMPLIDALKAIASQVVLLHHLAIYGPLAAALQLALPSSSGLLADYGRLAVQIFLVTGGFLAARALSGDGERFPAHPLTLIGRRYLRLALPFLVAIALAIIASALADRWLADDMIPARATLSQWLAHALLLHGVLGHASLSAGVWYVAIDFQLFALLALLLWLGRGRLLGLVLVVSLALAALFWFNRDARWDNWALYFFGSYGLGAIAWWASSRGRLLAWLGAILTVVTAALLVDFRLRIALALVIALSLGLARRSGLLQRWPQSLALAHLSQISYSVFLVHFPILLLANAAFAHWLPEASTTTSLLTLAATWLVANLAGQFFHRHVEAAGLDRRLLKAAQALAKPLGRPASSLLRAGRDGAQRLLLRPRRMYDPR